MNYDFDKIKKLIKDFYTVTGQRIGLFDKDFNILFEYPEKCCDFCKCIRKTQEGYDACIKSDKTFLEEASKGNTVRAYCHAGLLEICAPIVDDMGISGYLMFGQILYNDTSEKQYKEIERITKKYFKNDDFKKALKSVRTISEEYLSSVENIMTACISYIHVNRILTATKTGLWAQIDYYIERNSAKNFSLEEMADDLGVCVSSICKTVKTHSQKTVLQLLTEKRLNKAKNLLKTTSMNINEIAYAVGIQDYNYFTKLFKKHESLTPSAFRKNYQRSLN